ncbi:GH39 family glycosyl hydrolase [Pseudonocardia phyllosphaerae]|uniref:GH39 family glycosyl hydrolase n=1 Tax=Pseudonocardia phyllosphaerae TaxID=3390502 RepID=UPI00397D3B0C
MLAVLVASCTSGSGSDEPSSEVEAAARALNLDQGWTWSKQPEPMELGVTHTQQSLDDTENAEARARGTQVLSSLGQEYQNQHIMGFGALNPEPSPGQYDWSSLDRRMDLTKETGGKAMLTLCCAPDWMKGGPPGGTRWDKLEDNVKPPFYKDFAKLTAEAVKRYPQVDRVAVWNELKGFYHEDQNRWDYEGYTAMYNEVYKAVKAVRPDVQVGGPYVVMSSVAPDSSDASDVRGPWGALDKRPLDVLDYWLKHNVGADFIAVDGSTTNRGQQDAISPVDVGAQKFATIDDWISRRTELPIWWLEFYANVPADAKAGYDAPASAVSTLAVLQSMARSGTSGALLWGPEGSDDLKYSSLWSPATDADGGQPTPLTEAWKWLVPRLRSGDVELGRMQGSTLGAFRDADGAALIVNFSGDPVPVPGHDDIPGWAVVPIPEK